jgi:hypothetical protein
MIEEILKSCTKLSNQRDYGVFCITSIRIKKEQLTEIKKRNLNMGKVIRILLDDFLKGLEKLDS